MWPEKNTAILEIDHQIINIIVAYGYNYPGEKNMSKSQDKKKNDKTKPAKTPKEKKQAKRDKKDKKENPGLFEPLGK
jgi:hypothetical protein